MVQSRRQFVQACIGTAAWWSMAGAVRGEDKPLYEISLAEWSLHKNLFNREKKEKPITNLDFARISRDEFGIDAVEYVNQFFKDKATDASYLAEMNRRAADVGVKNLLIMIDGEGALGDPDTAQRTAAIDNHKKWVEAAKTLGCHSIRVNAQSKGKKEEQAKLAADGLARLSQFAAPMNINVIVENHGGWSSDGQWLSGVLAAVDMPNCGSLPDFGNFLNYDRYQGVQELMPFAKAVSAKSHDFDDEGNETKIDYLKMMKIVVDAGYHGYVGIEYEGSKLDEYAGIKATKKLLEKVRDQLSA